MDELLKKKGFKDFEDFVNYVVGTHDYMPRFSNRIDVLTKDIQALADRIEKLEKKKVK
jgi:ubiquinone biosynthesis protein UbiJ